MTSLHEEVERGNYDTVKRLLEDKTRPIDINGRDKKQQTALHLAACGENLELVKLLLRKDADANVQDRNGWTPLHTAAAAGQFLVCQLLLHVEDIDAAALNKDGTSPLHYLVRRTIPTHHVPIYVNLLNQMLERGAELNTQTKHGESPLHQAALHGNTEAILFLHKHHANMDILNKIGETPLHYALRAKKEDMVQLLLNCGANPLLASRQGGAPLEIAIQQNLQSIVAMIEKRIAEMPKPGEPENLIVRVFKATGLVLREDGSSPQPTLTITHGKETRSILSTGQPSTQPKWECEVMFCIFKLPSLGKLRLVLNDKTTKQFLGQITIILDSLNLVEKRHRGVYPLKKSRHHRDQRVSGKIEIDLCLIDCEASPIGSVESPKPESSSGSQELSPSASSSFRPKSIAFGTRRGSCTTSGCDCEEYQPETERGGPCMNCGHYPAAHQNLGSSVPDLSSTSGPSSSSSSSSSTSSSSSPSPRSPRLTKSAQTPVDKPKESTPSRGTPPMLGAQAKQSESIADITERFKASASSMQHSLTQSWEIDSSELVFVSRLGEGTSAKVFRGTYRGQNVAIKVLKEKVETKQLAEFEKEFLIMSSLRSPHVVFFYGACTSPSLSMVLEFCSNGSVHDVLSNPNQVIDWTLFHRMISDIMKAINCLHSWKPQIVHRDLKSLNLLVDENWTVKVCDFGLSRFTEGAGNNSTLGKLRGTYAYSAPEVYFGKKYDTKSDVYSIALILWEMVVRVVTGRYQQPYSEYKHLVFDFQIIIQTAKKDLRPTIPKLVPPPLVEIITRCWKPQPDERPDTPELMDILSKIGQHFHENRAQWDESCFDLLNPKTPPPAPSQSSEKSRSERKKLQSNPRKSKKS